MGFQLPTSTGDRRISATNSRSRPFLQPRIQWAASPKMTSYMRFDRHLISQPFSELENMGSYCWWKKSCNSWGWYVVYPIISKVLYIPGGQPDFFHRQYQSLYGAPISNC